MDYKGEINAHLDPEAHGEGVDPRDFFPWPQYRRATRTQIHVLIWFQQPAEGRVTLPFGDSRNLETSGHHTRLSDAVRSEVNGRAVRDGRTN